MNSRFPSVSFVYLVGVHVLAVVFFGYVYRALPIDVTQTLLQELSIGTKDSVTDKEREILYSVLATHPSLLERLTEPRGAAFISCTDGGQMCSPRGVILRKPGAVLKHLWLDISSPETFYPMQVAIGGDTWEETLSVYEPGRYRVPIPSTETVELVYLRARSRNPQVAFTMPGINVELWHD